MAVQEGTGTGAGGWQEQRDCAGAGQQHGHFEGLHACGVVGRRQARPRQSRD